MLKNKSMQIRSRKHRKKKPISLLMILMMSLCCLTSIGIKADRVFAEGTNRQYSLEGARYQLYTDAFCTTEAKDTNGNSAVLVTDAGGSSGTLNMNTGTYYAKEVAASKGYKLDTAVYTVTVTESNTASSPAAFTSGEPPVYGSPVFKVFKTSTDEEYVDYRKFIGAEFTVRYYDVADKSEIAGSTPKDTWTFVTVKKDTPGYDKDPAHFYAGFDWQTDEPVSSSRPGKSFYVDGSGNRVLPLGWFTIEETKAPSGFKLSGDICYGHVFQQTTGGDAVTAIEGQNIYGDAIREIVFKNEPCTTYIKKTDAATGKPLAGAKMQVLQGSTVVDEWVTTEAEHKIEELKAGTYLLREISAPYGYDIADDVSFTVTEGKDSHIEMKNVPVTIGTTAVAKDTGKHIGSIKTDEIITDTVHITGLYAGRKYKVAGKLVNKETEKAIKKGGKDITASKEFTATAAVMDVKVDFQVDSSQFQPGTKAVVFETLYRISKVHGEKVPAELQKHENINDTAQTVIFPGISTTAMDAETGTHNLLAEKDASITDTVTYKGLLTGETYRLEGEIYDKTEGKLTGIKSTAEFRPEAESGTATMDFIFDAGSMEGHTLVVFETLKTGDIVLAEHNDANDTDQTVYIPKIGTVAGISDNKHEIKDVITFENLLPDTEYVFRGWLVDTVTGEKVADSDGTVNVSTGSKRSGKVEMILKTEKYDDIQGHSMTAFEELYMVVKENGADKEIPVAYHKDLNDGKQTVEIYHDLIIQKKVTGNLGDRAKEFEYTAEFTDLVPNQSYAAEGDDEKVFNADVSGTATVPFRLRDGEKVTIKRLPKNSHYRITEAPSDHAAEYSVSSEDMAEAGARILQPEGDKYEDTGSALSTALETVDMFDGTVVVLWKNNRETAPLTGFAGINYLVYGSLIAILTSITIAVLRRHKRYCEENDASA